MTVRHTSDFGLWPCWLWVRRLVACRRAAGPMPQGGDYTGVWFSPQYGELHMQQTAPR